MKIRLYGVINDSIVDGPGLRYVLFMQGCLHHCLDCHNPKSHALTDGYQADTDTCFNDIMDNPLLDGVTLSGGEPFLQASALIPFVKKIKQEKLHVMIYSGYTFEEILTLGEPEYILLSLCDVLVDGKFVKAQKDLQLSYRGSANQRLIDVKKSLTQGEVVEYCVNQWGELIS